MFGVAARSLNMRWGAVIAIGALACSSSAAPATATTSCSPSAGVSGAPSSIADAVVLANDLLARQPEGLTVPCFVESLDRPLGVQAVNSIFSVQPAVGPRSPRIFLFSGNLVMSVVPEGDTAHSIELAEYLSPTRSIKAEIGFPLQAPISSSAPFDRVRDGEGTWCRGCHRDETRADSVTIAEAFGSDVLRPAPADEVPLPYVANEASACDSSLEPGRCAMLDAVFGHGPVEPRAFSRDARTINDY